MKPFKGPAKQRGFLGLLSLAVTAIGAVGSAKKAKKADKANQRAALDEKEIRSIRNLQAKRKFLKDFRLTQAVTIASGGAVEGGLDSSRSQGERASASTQARVGVAEQGKLGELDASAVSNAVAAAKFKSQASRISTIAGLASSAINLIPTAPNSTPVITEQPLGGLDT